MTTAPAPQAPAKEAESWERLFTESAQFFADPLGWVEWAYPWGVEGTRLADEEGPDLWQTDILETIGQWLRGELAERDMRTALQMAVASGHGVGKVLSNRITVATPDGERSWADIEPGDQLFGASGEPTTVTTKYPHTRWPFYRVTFDDGSFTYAGPEHLWAVRGRQERRKHLDGWRVLSTAGILRAGVKRPNGAAAARQWEVPVQGPAQYPEHTVPVHPYVMGIWLGDGHRGEPAYTKPHPEIRRRIESLGYTVCTAPDGKHHRLIGAHKHFADPVFALNSHERYIPDRYKFNSIDNRRELLRGLLDSDGEVYACGSIGYSSTSKRLAHDVLWLARSLGAKARMQCAIKHGWYPKDGQRVECRDCYRVSINLDWNPFTHEARRRAYKPSERRYLVRWIDSIEFDHYGDGHCVTVDAPDSLYCANDFIVTHNTALLAWIIEWFLATRSYPQVVVTAGTEPQLSAKTWRELAKWKRLCRLGRYYSWTKTRYYLTGYDDTWFAAAIPWSEHNPDAFAGTHERHVLLIYDEASAIADVIWETSEGAMTTPGAIWLAFGNPTKNTGRFADCFRRFRHRWLTRQVDSRMAKMANQDQIQQWIEDYGEDHDFVRVRVRGVFPRAATNQLISLEDVSAARRRTAEGYEPLARIMGMDVAREGDDESCIVRRQGPKVHELQRFRIPDLMQVAARFAAEIDAWEPDAVFLDAEGMGAGVYDRLIQLGYDMVHPVRVGDPSSKIHSIMKHQYHDLRSELWGEMQTWLQRAGADLPADDQRLEDDLIGPEYGFDEKNRIWLERKKDMKKRGLPSPDSGDALALTFTFPVRPRENQRALDRRVRRSNWRL